MASNLLVSTDLLIIVPPAGAKATVYPPYGAMYIAAALRNKGYKAGILNADAERIENGEVIARLRQADPRYIGFSGIVAPSYKYIKTLSREIKKCFPDKVQILGGGLSSAAETVLKNTAIDIIVKGEGDATVTELFECLYKGGELDKIAGIYYRKGASFSETGDRRLITDLDSLSYPAFDLVDMRQYMPDGIEFMKRFTSKIKPKYLDAGRTKMITIPTSRGCFGQCSFCFRAYPGIRLNSIKYVFDLIEYCISKFNVSFFTFGDECFAANKARNWDFIEEYKKRKLDFNFRILGMRVDTVDRDILHAYKDIGCWMIEYGFESGSQKMLNIIDKRVSVEQNRQVALWTEEAGIYTSPTLVIGMPGENDQTIAESISFIRSLKLGYKQYQWSYALPIPGAPLYDFAKIAGIIDDDERYLLSLDGKVAGAGVFHVNLTDQPDASVAGWAGRISREIDDDYFKRTCSSRLLVKATFHYKNGDLPAVIAGKLKSFFPKADRVTAGAEATACFGNKKNVSIEGLLKGLDGYSVNREMALKKINQRFLQSA
jgi:radical SAM superfamily enzyme YgiQ (UPF0313 family)